MAAKIKRQKKYLQAKYGSVEDEMHDDEEDDKEEKNDLWGGIKNQRYYDDNRHFELQSIDDAKRMGDAFAHAFSAHLARLMEEPAAYGKFGLANLLKIMEECLREFTCHDAYRSIKQRENEASLAVLPDVVLELDSMNEETRLFMLIEGVLAINIFEWGSCASMSLYHKRTIIEIYRMSHNKMERPRRVDDFDAFKERMLGSRENKPHPHKRALLFVDNSGADIILEMLTLAMELLKRGTEVVLVANSLHVLNDITVTELPVIVAEAAKHCGILHMAAEAGGSLLDAMINTSEGSKENSPSVPLMVVDATIVL